jgi:hypothetical protein
MGVDLLFEATQQRLSGQLFYAWWSMSGLLHVYSVFSTPSSVTRSEGLHSENLPVITYPHQRFNSSYNASLLVPLP